ncbi:hypothetical protein [uncultured Paraglaciecola sp.]|uniref:hypothetical protein n=1 Tax=uncultured Paraglaciecola sp. TaxID=1765024 RepID=UPI0025F4FC99|nr:hypothetical protein [uncultured Paraglaciecola sp.]
MTSDNKKIMRFGLYIITTIFSLIYVFYEESETEKNLSEVFDNKIFGIQGVTTKVTHFSNMNTNISIKFESNGLPEIASSYKPGILAFVCTHPFFKEELLKGKFIDFDMSAFDRADGKHVNMKIDGGRCKYDL